MADRRTDPSLQDLNRGVLAVAAALVVGACVVGASGLALGAAAVVSAGRHRYRRADLTPQQPAKLKWEQARAAAGAGAWRDTELNTYSPRSCADATTWVRMTVGSPAEGDVGPGAVTHSGETDRSPPAARLRLRIAPGHRWRSIV